MAIQELLYYRESLSGDPIESFGDFQNEFGLDADGVNAYLGLAPGVLDTGGSVLSASSASNVIDSVVQFLATTSNTQKMVMLGLEPNEPTDPFGFIRAHYAGIETLATEIDQIQQQVAAQSGAAGQNRNNALRVVVRYASEMNGGNPYSGQPADFIDTYQQVRQRFAQLAPRVEFAFSPELSGASLSNIVTYWPGANYVDVISGTWYVRGQTSLSTRVAFLKSYLAHFLSSQKPFALDEVGASLGNATVGGNGDELAKVLTKLRTIGHDLSYVTLFINRGGWGADMTGLPLPLTR